MARLMRLLARLRRRPVDPERALERARADAARRRLYDDPQRGTARGLGGWDAGGGF